MMGSKVLISVWLAGIPFSIIAQVFDEHIISVNQSYEA